jgi:hypothetical protein
MKIPNWAKLVWWGVLVGTLTYFLWARLPDLLSGKATAADIAVFGVWMALLLSPLFTEVELFGVTLKNEIEELKDDLTAQIGDIRNDIRNAVDVRATVSPVFNMPSPPKDSELPEMLEEIKSAISSAFAERGAPPTTQANINVPEEVAFLFETRYNLEREVRRLAAQSGVPNRPVSIQMVGELMAKGVLPQDLGHAVRDAYRVCSPAIHGDSVSPEKVMFVREVASGLIAALRAI